MIDFLLAMVWTAAIGFLMWLLTRRYKGELSIRHGYLLVVTMWTAMPAVATLPLLLVIEDLSFTDAYFETMSGITTTGATVLTGLDDLPPAINIWRHELSWLGGMGIIVLAVAILPVARRRRTTIVQGGNARADEGFRADAAHHRNCAQPVAGLSGHHDRLYLVIESRGHELAGCDLPCVCHDGAGRFFHA